MSSPRGNRCRASRSCSATARDDFSQPATSPEAAGDAPFSVAVGDFNGDGKQDLATANINSANVTILLNRPDADLSISKSDSPDPAIRGGLLTYTLGVANAGPDRATGVVVEDMLSNSVDFVSASSSRGSCAQNGGRVRCELGALGAGESAHLRIVVRPRTAAIIANTGRVESRASDPDTEDNSASESTTVRARFPGGAGAPYGPAR